jgi:hypothetical protein
MCVHAHTTHDDELTDDTTDDEARTYNERMTTTCHTTVHTDGHMTNDVDVTCDVTDAHTYVCAIDGVVRRDVRTHAINMTYANTYVCTSCDDVSTQLESCELYIIVFTIQMLANLALTHNSQHDHVSTNQINMVVVIFICFYCF